MLQPLEIVVVWIAVQCGTTSGLGLDVDVEPQLLQTKYSSKRLGQNPGTPLNTQEASTKRHSIGA